MWFEGGKAIVTALHGVRQNARPLSLALSAEAAMGSSANPVLEMEISCPVGRPLPAVRQNARPLSLALSAEAAMGSSANPVLEMEMSCPVARQLPALPWIVA